MAPDDKETSERFVLGHQKVLSEIGVKVTSGGNEWIDDPFVCVLAVENSNNENEIVGGARLHIAHRGANIPMIDAIGEVDSRIFKEIDDILDEGVAELCGLWNARSIAGLGIGSNLLVRTCIALTSQLKLGKLVALVAKHTFRRAVEKGFRVMDTIGDKGEFVYPKMNYIATAIVLDDAINIPLAIGKEKDEVFDIRNKPNEIITQEWPKGSYPVEFAISLQVKINIS